MAKSVSASEFQRNAGVYFEQAVKAPLRITKHGRPAFVVMDIATFNKLKQGQRRAIMVRDLSDEDKEAVRRAEIPTGHRYATDDIE